MKRAVAVVVLAATAVLGACIPSPEPPPPGPSTSWQPTVRMWSESPGDGPEYAFAATNHEWWAVVEAEPGFQGPATLHLHPRTAPGGAPREEPEFSFPLADGARAVAMSDHVVAVRSLRASSGELAIELFELEESTWSAAGRILRPDIGTRDHSLAVTDEHLVIGERGRDFPEPVEGQVAVVPISLAGPGISWSQSEVVTLTPDPAWPIEARHGFGGRVSIAKDVLAVSTQWDRVIVLRHANGTWVTEQTLVGGNPLAGETFGNALSLDRTGAARVVIGVSGGWHIGVPQAGKVEVYEHKPGGWSRTRTIGPRPGNALNGLGFGAHVALDGDNLVVAAHLAPVPRGPEADDGTVNDYRLELHDLARTPSFDQEVSLIEVLGGVDALPGATNVGAFTIDLSGTHVAASVLVGFGSDPMHMASVSLDRH